MLEDVSEEHARKTITVDPFPHTGVLAASIHPCKHASVMKKLGSMAEASGKPFLVDRYSLQSCSTLCAKRKMSSRCEALQPTLLYCRAFVQGTQSSCPRSYLVLFLKFIASVIPTIE